MLRVARLWRLWDLVKAGALVSRTCSYVHVLCILEATQSVR